MTMRYAHHSEQVNRNAVKLLEQMKQTPVNTVNQINIPCPPVADIGKDNNNSTTTLPEME